MDDNAVYASRSLQALPWLTLLCGLLLTALAGSRFISGDGAPWVVWALAAYGPLQVLYSAWQISLVHQPIVRVTPAEVAIRSIWQRRPITVGGDEIVGLRWQDSFDLRLCLREGGEVVVPLRQIARRDRPGVQELLRAIVGGTRAIV